MNNQITEYNNLSAPYVFTYKDSYKYLTNICLNITDACNLGCKYCFVEQSPHYMTYDIAKQTVDWIYKNLQIKKEHGYCSLNEKASINFFGGEPTLLWDDIIVPLTNYIFNNYKDDICLGITTNGTLLDEEKIKFMYEHNFKILLSIDGDKPTQDFNRPCKNGNSSFDLVKKNIPYILKYFPNITFRATIYQQSVKHTFENYLFAEKMGFKNIFMIPDEREEWTQENIVLLKEEINKICYYILLYFLNNQIPPLHYELFDRAIDKIKFVDIETACRNNRFTGQKTVDRCGLGTTYGSVNYEGKIFGCQEQDSRYNTNSIFEIGDIFNGIDYQKHYNLLEQYTNQGITYSEDIKLCDNCKLKLHCISDTCPSTSMDLFQNFAISPKMHCIFNQHMADNIITIEKILTEQNNLVFKQYCNKIFNKE